MGKSSRTANSELPIIQQTYDLIKWFIPILNKLYVILEELIHARYEKEKLARLESINKRLDVITYQTRLLRDFDLIDLRRYGYVSKLLTEIGRALGGWIGQQRSLVK